jgi:teichuronic acid biosynthesis glycosyltransferase TuaH
VVSDCRLLVLGTADWDSPIATNQHYVVRELARTQSVLYSESIGLRRPTLSSADLRRVARRMHVAHTDNAPQREVPERVTIVTPRVIPLHTAATRKINRGLLRSAARPWLKGTPPRILWTYSPVTYGLEDEAEFAVYHCVDLLGAIEGIDRATIDAAERILAAKGVRAIGSSRTVVAHLRDVGFGQVDYWPNVADTSMIVAERPVAAARVRRAIFAGKITGDKVDYDLLHAVLEAGMPLVIAGPVGRDSDRVALDLLVQSGAEYLGHLEFGQLAREYWKSQVGLIPYPVNAYTAGVSPLKLYEYLAAGLHVVSTPLPEIQDDPPNGVTVSADADHFASAAATSLFSEQDAAERISTAHGHSWDARGDVARALLVSALDQPLSTDSSL